jgi:hypothetical protein
MKKFWVGTYFSGEIQVFAYNVCEAAYKVRRKLTKKFDDITYVTFYDSKMKRYIMYEKSDFEEWTEKDYDEFLYS